MGTITATPVIEGGHLRVEVNWADFPHARRCWVYRKMANADDSTRVVIRDGDRAWLSGNVAVAFDHEAPLDQLVQYTSQVPLNWNGDFEDGVLEWQDTTLTGTIGAVTQSLDYYVPDTGQASLMLAPTGGATARAVSEFIPATAGQSYTIAGRLMVPQFWTGGIGLQIFWYNGSTFLTGTGASDDFTPIAGQWGTYGFAATAPATTTQCRIVAVCGGSPPLTMRLFADELYLTTAGNAVTSAPVSMPSNGGGWWTDPLHPWSKVRLLVDLDSTAMNCDTSSAVAYLGVGDETFPADSALLEVNDSPNPIGTWNRRKSGRQSMRVSTKTADDLARVKRLHAAGAPLLLQLDARYGEADAYALHGELGIGRIHGEQSVPWRLAVTSFGKHGAPVGPAEGTLRARYVDITKYATFRDALLVGNGVWDDWSRVVANGWGPTPQGLTWVPSGTVANIAATGALGTHTHTAVGANLSCTLPLSVLNLADVDLMVDLDSNISLPAGGNIVDTIDIRYVDANNHYKLFLSYLPNNTVTIALLRVLAGAQTTVAGSALTVVPGVGSTNALRVRFQLTGTGIRAKVWNRDSGPEPVLWQISGSDTQIASGGLRLSSFRDVGNTDATVQIRFDNLQVTNLAAAPTWLNALQGKATL